MAAVFGVSGELDAYLMAFTLIGFPSAFLLNATQSAFIPALVRAAGQADRRDVVQSTVAGAILVVGLALGLLLILLPKLVPLIGWGFTLERQLRVIELCYALVPYYFLTAINLLGYGALQADRRFMANGSLPAVVPTMTVLVLVLFGGETDARLLVYGVTIGAGLELLLLQVLLAGYGLSLLPRLGRHRIGNRTMWREAAVLMPGTAIWGAVPLIDQTLSSGLGEGAIASLAYGARIPAAVNAILVTAIGVSALPYLSQMMSENRLRDCHYAVRRLSGALLAMGGLVAAILIAASDWLIGLIYQRGAFDEAARGAVVPIQQAYAAQLPGLLVGMLAVRVHVAQGRGAKLTVVAAFTALLYAACALLLSRLFGIVGIAATAAVVSIFNAAWLYRSAEQQLARSIE